MVRKIVENVPEGLLKQDMEKYRQRAIELGAADAKVITSDMVIIDDRVRIKCIYPKCKWYGTNRNCPPYALELDQIRKMVNGFSYAIFIQQILPTEISAGKRTPESHKISQHFVKTQAEILSKVESEAFYDGYYLAVAFGSGPCKGLFCPADDCAALTLGKGCRHPLRARSAMEAVGMDAFKMAAKVGWDVYPIGVSPSNAPHANRLGIVFIY
jgi:predicted metal-binding protein